MRSIDAQCSRLTLSVTLVNVPDRWSRLRRERDVRFWILEREAHSTNLQSIKFVLHLRSQTRSQVRVR